MRFAPFLAAREARRARALAASAGLRRGDRVAARAALGSLRLPAPARDTVIDAILAARPTPTAPQAAASLVDPEHLPADDEDLSPAVRRRRHESTRLPQADDTPAWAIETLAFVGEEIERSDRDAWRTATYPPHEDDARVGAAWARWFDGHPWDIRATWEGWFIKDAVVVFRAVADARRLPPDVTRRAVSDLREAVFYALVGKEQPGWADVASRVLEGAPPGPVEALAGALGGEGWDRVAGCATSRGNWPDTASVLFRDLPGAPARALALRRAGTASPATVEEWLDLHVALRVIAGWSDGGTAFDDARAVIAQNRGRARARLRAALLATSCDQLHQRIRKLPGLKARTAAAMRRWAWSWAWQELASDFAFDLGHVVTPPCDAGGPIVEPIAGEDDAIATWVLLVALKGRLDWLRKWARTGSTGDRDSTWGRLLADEFPEVLRDAAVAGRARSYHRVRATLVESFEERLAALVPALRDVCALPADRTARTRFTERFGGTWHASVPFPRSGFPTFIQNARDALDAMAARTEDPCT